MNDLQSIFMANVSLSQASRRKLMPNQIGDGDRQTRHNNVMHAKPDLRVVLKWMIYRSGSVITDVIWLISSYAILDTICTYGDFRTGGGNCDNFTCT